MTALPTGFPPAVLGFKAMRPGIAVRVCAWCPGKLAAEKWAHPLPVSHGACERCAQRLMVQLLGEKIEA